MDPSQLLPAIEVPIPQTMRELLNSQAKRFASKPFLLFPERHQILSYADVQLYCTQFACLLNQLGIGHQDKVALLLPNIPEFVVTYWGTMAFGAVAAPVNTLLSGPEIQYILHHCEAKVLVTTQAFAKELNRIWDQLPLLEHILIVQDTLALQSGELQSPESQDDSQNTFKTTHPILAFEHAVYAQPIPGEDTCFPAIDTTDVAMIIYTSGTTGKPKGVMLTHQNLLANARSIARWFDFTPDTRLMNILPLFHVNGEVVTLNTPWVMGGSVVLNRKFSASQFWPLIRDYHVNAFSTVPTILSILIAQGHPGFETPSLQLGICGAAPLPVEVHQSFETMFNIPIFEGYGLSESTCYSTFNPPDLSKRKIGTIGLAVDNEVAIWDTEHQPVSVGELGEIVIRGENVMPGYFKNPEATEKAFAGGWFHTGDVGKMDEDGFFSIVDRVKDMIIRGGENIYPREIDEVLYQHPQIQEAATVGIPDPKYGEEVKSFVVLKPGESLTAEDVMEYCQQFLAPFKCPKTVAFVSEIPKGPTGKLLRRALKDLETA